MGKISVLIVDDHPMVRELLARRQSAQPDFTVVAHTGHPTVAADLAWFWEPDVILRTSKGPMAMGRTPERRVARASPTSHLVALPLTSEPTRRRSTASWTPALAWSRASASIPYCGGFALWSGQKSRE